MVFPYKNADTGWKMIRIYGCMDWRVTHVREFPGLLHSKKRGVCFLIFPTNLHVYASTLPLTQSPLWWAFTVSKATYREEERGLDERREKQDKMQENKIEWFKCMDLTLVRLTVHQAWSQDRMCWQLPVVLPLNWEEIHFPQLNAFILGHHDIFRITHIQ